MMLAQRVDLDVAHADQVFVALAVQGVADDVGDGHVVAPREPLERRFHARGRLAQALPRRILAELREHVAHQRLEYRPPFRRRPRVQRLGVLLAVANLTGAIGLLLGLGWPRIYFVFAAAGRRKAVGAQHAAPLLPAIRLEPEHAVEVVGLVPPLLYFGVILLRESFGWIDAMVLLALYAAYLWTLFRTPPRHADKVSDAPVVARWAYRQRGWRRQAAIGGLFAAGGGLRAPAAPRRR